MLPGLPVLLLSLSLSLYHEEHHGLFPVPLTSLLSLIFVLLIFLASLRCYSGAMVALVAGNLMCHLYRVSSVDEFLAALMSSFKFFYMCSLYLIFYCSLVVRYPDVRTNPGPRYSGPRTCRLLCATEFCTATWLTCP